MTFYFLSWSGFRSFLLIIASFVIMSLTSDVDDGAFPVLPNKKRFPTLLDNELCNLRVLPDPAFYFPVSFTAILQSSDPSERRFYIRPPLRYVGGDALSETLKGIYNPPAEVGGPATTEDVENTIVADDIAIGEEYVYIASDGLYKRGRVEQVVYSEPPMVQLTNLDSPTQHEEVEVIALRSIDKFFSSSSQNIHLMCMEVVVPAGFRVDDGWMRRAKKGDLVDVTLFNLTEPTYGVFESAQDITSPFNAITLGRHIFEEDFSSWEKVLCEQSRKVCTKGSYPFLTRPLTEKKITCFVIGHENDILYVRDTECFLALNILKLVLASYGSTKMEKEFQVHRAKDLRVGCGYVVKDATTNLFYRAQLVQVIGNRLTFADVDYPSRKMQEIEFSEYFLGAVYYPFESLLIPRLFTTVSVADFKGSQSTFYDELIGSPLTLEYNEDNKSYVCEVRTECNDSLDYCPSV